MIRVTSIKKSGEVPKEIIDAQTVKQMAEIGKKEYGDFASTSFYQEIIIPIQNMINTYLIKFDTAYQNYLRENGLVRKMKQMQAVSSQEYKEDKTLQLIDQFRYNNNRRATNEFIQILDDGHSLLLDIRKVFTDQTILTKFIVQTDDGLFVANEENVSMNKVLSRYGSSQNNPFSVAYQLEQKLIDAKNGFEKVKDPSLIDLWKEIYAAKRPYLDKKTLETGRIYKVRFYDSKDAEIFELYACGEKTEFNVDIYSKLRASLGGGGGYASAFHKKGDIGLTQIKFFNLTENNKNAAANYSRMQLLQNRFQQLSTAFNSASPETIKQALLNVFTENQNILEEAIDKRFNLAAIKAIESLFEGF